MPSGKGDSAIPAENQMHPMLISDQKKLIFIHIQKTGGTSISSILRSTITDMRSIHRPHSPAELAKNDLGSRWDEYYKFAFVRNPWDRLVSFYFSILQNEIKLSQSQLEYFDKNKISYNKVRQFVLHNTSNFEQFILYCEHATSKSGWRPFLQNQFEYISQNGNIIVDYIGRYESYDKDFRFIADKFNIPFTEVPHVNKSKRQNYRTYYTTEIKNIVKNRFSKDIEKFDYHY